MRANTHRHTHTRAVNTCRSHMNLHTDTHTHVDTLACELYCGRWAWSRIVSCMCGNNFWLSSLFASHTHTHTQPQRAKSAAKVIDGRNCFARYNSNSNNNNGNKGPAEQPHTTPAMRVHKAKQIIANWQFRYSIWGLVFVCVCLLSLLFSGSVLLC